MKIVPKTAASWKNYDCATIGISMGSPQHTGIVFESLFNWTKKHFKSCIIDLSDTLDRHNYISENVTEQQAYATAKLLGDQWIKNHQEIIDQSNIPVQLIRWDHWLQHPDYQKNLTLFHKAFAEQALFRNAVMADVAIYYNRKGISINYMLPDQVQHSINYLLEELAAHSILYKEHLSTTLYPGKQHNCYTMVCKGFVKNVPDGLQQSSYTRMVVYNFDNDEEKLSVAG